MATMSENERLVRAAWVAPNWSRRPEGDWVVQDYSVGGGMTILARDQKTRALASAAAAEFTRKRQQEIAELQIRAAAIKANWLNAGVEIIARLQPAPMPKPKTAEERVKERMIWVLRRERPNMADCYYNMIADDLLDALKESEVTRG